MEVDAIIQARMGSTRLPGKVLKEIGGRPMLWHVVRRTGAARSLRQVIVATTTQPDDDEIEAFCSENKIICFRGSEDDVLDRYYQAACQHQAQGIVRITSDCPLIDREIVDKTVDAFLAGQPEYASNTIVRTYPRGLDTEVMTFSALQAAWTGAALPYERAHVTPYLYQNPDRFKILSVTGEKDYSAYRWTVDTPEDLEFVRTVYRRFGNREFFWRDTIDLMKREPELAEINGWVTQKALHEG